MTPETIGPIEGLTEIRLEPSRDNQGLPYDVPVLFADLRGFMWLPFRSEPLVNATPEEEKPSLLHMRGLSPRVGKAPGEALLAHAWIEHRGGGECEIGIGNTRMLIDAKALGAICSMALWLIQGRRIPENGFERAMNMPYKDEAKATDPTSSTS